MGTTIGARTRVLVRLALGVAQMVGAVAGVVLLVQTGVSTWSLALVAPTLL